MAMASPTATPPALLEATRNSTSAWQDDLQALFEQAKERFPDVVWELSDGMGIQNSRTEEIWGHKAIVYSRAPPSFQQRYFNLKPPRINSPNPYSTSPTPTLPAQSAVSLALGADYGVVSRSPSPFHRGISPAPSTTIGGILRLPTNANPTLFSNELEYLYTGKGFGEAFEFLFDSQEQREEGDAEEARIDKLRKDLVFMWRSRLYSDVRLALTGNFSTNHENTTAIFSSHRFILVSRSPYFHTQLLQWGVGQSPGEPLTLTLPSPPFTPASLHFTLGFIYTGTLVFSHRTFDLDTAFHIMRSANYLSLDTLCDEIQARIVQEMMHGLFHAFLEFAEYERITGGKWGTGGCKCRQCARRAPRVLEFALMDDVKNTHLERGARRALVGLFGEGWSNPDFARLSQKIRQGILVGVAKRTTPMNIFPLLFASHKGLAKLNGIIEPWVEISKDMILSARKTIDEVICTKANECFEQGEWLVIMEGDGARFEDAELVEWVMEAVRRGMNEKNAGHLYQTLVSSILLRPHLTEPSQTMLSSTSHVRVQVEQTRMDIIRWLKRRWIGVKQECGFDELEPWALKEISHGLSLLKFEKDLDIDTGIEIEVPVEDMFSPPNATPSATPRRPGGLRVSKLHDDASSMHSLRPEAVSRNGTRGAAGLKSSATSIRSVARSTHSTISRASVASHRTVNTSNPRPDSKLTPDHTGKPGPASVKSMATLNDGSSALSIRPARRQASMAASASDSPGRACSSSSIRSVKSQASTIRKVVPAPSNLRPPSGLSRPSSTMSSTSENSTAFETAKSDASPTSAGRSRVLSSASTTSTKSTTTLSASKAPRSRVPSAASRASVTSRKPPPSPVDNNRLSTLPAKRTVSTSSDRSTISATSTSTSSKKATVRKSRVPPTPPPKVKPHLPPAPNSVVLTASKSPLPSSSTTAHDKHGSVTSTASASTVKGTLKRKSSSDTVRDSGGSTVSLNNSSTVPRGATLDIGIPCIVSSKRARFRAYARYIGEVEGEAGPWVGIEVPVNDDWPDDRLEGQQWHDGTWGGIRYFEISSSSDWGYGDERATRRRRVDWVSNGVGSHFSLKREGDQLSIDRTKRFRSVSPAASDLSNSESRGLFVRPQQVLYVVDAVA
ncbi:hypothetical protein BDY19DRAFT_955832 [Irpex rosettiformis]|uniref:Uncharacterized protein n=1 Tax=Irpex rosettiformis TaxID=378272 RepID=A0ACB8TZD2_9APHY|nr:hypothetical protein BDY19DRAFT_955832 [Irpex rosettiformis]